MKKQILLLALSLSFFQIANAQCPFSSTVNGNTATFTPQPFATIYVVDSLIYDYGDGTTANIPLTQPNNSHTYATSGTYNVCHTYYMHQLGFPTVYTCNYCDSVTIQGGPATGCFVNGGFNFNASGLSVSFQNTTTCNGCTSLTTFWDYGDGNTSTMWQQTHTYTVPGTYTVCQYQTGINANNVTCIDTTCQTVTVTQGQGCTSTIQVSATGSTVTAIGAATGGTGPYTYSYTLNPGSQMNSTGVFTGLTPGLYTVCVTAMDNMQNICSSACDSVAVGNVFGCTTSLTAQATSSTSISASASASFGTPPYTYVYNLNPVNITNSTGTFTGLTPGTYVVCATAYDANFDTCTTACNTITTMGPPAGCNTTINATGGSNSVTASATASFGTPPYTYSYTLNPGNITNSTGSFTGLTPGLYSVCATATDANNLICNTDCDSVSVGNVFGCSTNVNVVGGSNSVTATATASFGTPPYTYSYTLNPGNVTNGTGNFTGLTPGMYTVCATATDANNITCTPDCDSVTVGSTSPCISTIQLSSSSTPTGYNITAVGGATGGSAPYTYVYTLNPGSVTNSTGLFSGLVPGFYVVCVTAYDNMQNVCSSACDSISIGSSVNCSTAITANATGTTINANATASFGTPPYIYSYTLNPGNITNATGTFTNLAPGAYIVCATAVDANNVTCVSDCDSAWIGNGPGSCFVTAQFTQNINGLQVNFINNSTIAGGTITSTSWDFGDGNFSTTNSPSHNYASPGFYTVTLVVTGVDANQVPCIDTTVKQMMLSYPTSVNNVAKNKLVVYPNPTSNDFTITLPEGEKIEKLVLTDVAGREISADYKLQSNKFASVSLDNRASGIYFIKLQTDRQLYTSSIMKQE